MLSVFLNKSIKIQLLSFLFSLTALTILIVSFLGVKALFDLGTKTEKIAGDAMHSRVEQFLVETTTATASKNSQIFKNMQLETNNAAVYTKRLFDNQNNLLTNNWRFDDHVIRKPTGQWVNASTEESSVWIPNYVTLTSQLKRTFETTSYLDYLLPQIIANEPNAIALYFMGTQGETRYYPNIDFGTVVPPDYDPTKDVFFSVATPKNNPSKEIKWTPVYDDPAGNGLIITASNPIYTREGVFVGIIGMDLTLSKVAKNIEDYSPIESSYAFLIDKDKRAIALPEQGYKDIFGRSPKKNEHGPNLRNVTGDFGSVLQQMADGRKGFSSVKAGSTNLKIAYSPIEGTPFSLAIVAREAVLLQVVNDVQSQVKSFTQQVLYLQIIPIGIIILLLCWIFSFFYIRFITEPITTLTDKTRLIMQGDFEQRIPVHSSNELGKLAAAFNTMTEQLAQLYHGLEKKVNERTTALNQKVQELEIAKAKDEAILGSIGDGMIVTDSNGIVLLINTIATQLLGFTNNQFLGKALPNFDLYTESNKFIELKDQPMQRALQKGIKVVDSVKIGKEPGSGVVSITATPVIQAGNVIGTIQIIRDITKEKEVDRMKTEFISLASHQLRTPLSAIKWFGEMLLGGDAGKLNPEQEEFTRNITLSTQRMIDLVNSLLNISRIESGRIIVEPQPTDLKELVSQIVDDLKGKTAGRNQTLKIDIQKDLPQINLDPKLIGQVYMNLLTNAIKYTPVEGKIVVNVSIKDNKVFSSVTDTGYGIPKNEQSRVFEKFFRASNIAKVEVDGTGLGMYLVKAIIETSGGKIWFESEEGKGTTFFFTLPLQGMKKYDGDVSLS